MVKYIRNIIRQRELLFHLALVDFKLKYRNPFLGVLWAVIMPLLTISIYWWLFSSLMSIRIEKYPFFIYMMTAVFPWMYLQSSVLSASTSLIDKGTLVKRVNIPREIIPLSVVVSNLLNFFINLTLLFILLIVFKIGISWNILLLPLVILMQITLIAGFSLLASALNVKYRDTRYIMEMLFMALFFLTPSVYSLELLGRFSPIYLKLYLLNPFVGIVILYRICLLKDFVTILPSEVNIFNVVGIPLITSVLLLFLGFRIFHRRKEEFSDFI